MTLTLDPNAFADFLGSILLNGCVFGPNSCSLQSQITAAIVRPDEFAIPRRMKTRIRPMVAWIFAGLVLSAALLWVTRPTNLDPQAFLEAVGWARKPESLILFPESGASTPRLPRGAAQRWKGLVNMLRVDRFETSALLIPGGQDLDSTPIVFIHGLMSTPDMWSGVVRSLRSDPELARRYQCWFFYYPTGQPIPLSALQLRETLDQAARAGRIRRPAVLVGHSMGGLVARAQAAGLGPVQAEAILPGVSTFGTDQLVHRALLFQPRSDIGRLVFIATPHGGTEFAFRGISRLGHYLIRLPYWILAEISAFQEAIPQLGNRQFPTSIAGLSPGSAFLRELRAAPLAAPAHSIIPILGDPESPLAHDGIVPLQSSRIPVVESEIIIPGAHGAFDTPESLAELHRILRLHVGIPPK